MRVGFDTEIVVVGGGIAGFFALDRLRTARHHEVPTSLSSIVTAIWVSVVEDLEEAEPTIEVVI